MSIGLITEKMIIYVKSTCYESMFSQYKLVIHSGHRSDIRFTTQD